MSFPFPLPILTTCWGLRAGDWTPEVLANMAKQAGFKSVAVQLGQVTKPQVAALQAAGLFVVGWEVANTATAPQLSDLAVDGWAPQVEGPGERDPLFHLLDAGFGRSMPKAVFTTYGGLDTIYDVSHLRSLGIEHALVECYRATGETNHSRIDVMLAAGQSYGFKLENLAPVIGTYAGEQVSDYTWDGKPGAWLEKVGARFGVYNAEQTAPAAWTELAAIAQPVEPPSTDDSVMAVGHLYGSTVGKRALKSWREDNPKEARKIDLKDYDPTHYATMFGKFLAHLHRAATGPA